MSGVKKMFSPKMPTMTPVKGPDPVRMPTMDKTEAVEAERTRLMKRQRDGKGGRDSTRLGDYGGTILGSGG